MLESLDKGTTEDQEEKVKERKCVKKRGILETLVSAGTVSQALSSAIFGPQDITYTLSFHTH